MAAIPVGIRPAGVAEEEGAPPPRCDAAWDRLMDQYGRLIWSITRDFKLAESDASDVVQTTWLRLVEHIDRLEHPERVGAWLATTARNECLRGIAARKRLVLVGEEYGLESIAGHEQPVDEALLAAERAGRSGRR